MSESELNYFYEDILFEEETNNSIIYKAKNKKTGNYCFLKVINKEKLKLGDYDFLLKQIKREEQINNLCNSENIVNFYNKLETQESIIFELEMCEINLNKYLSDNRALKGDKNLFKDIVLQLANALRIIHQKGAMHRDIKPNNIFIKNTNDDKKIIKLGDFGCSILIKDNTSYPIGTILYTAPEIIKNLKYDEKCDLWSLGITLYQLYFGVFPYGHNPTINKIKKTIYDEKNFLLKQSNIPTLDILFNRLLVINPKERMTYNEFFSYVFNKDFMENNVICFNDNIMYMSIYQKILNQPEINYPEIEGYDEESFDKEEIQKKFGEKILAFVQEGNLPDIMNFSNGSINGTQKFNNIIYYDENINYSANIYQDSDFFESNTSGAFILCTNLESLEFIKKEILKENKNDKRITFNLITTGGTFEKIMSFLEKEQEFKKCILNACIYCLNLKKYEPLKDKYINILHDDIYNTQGEVVTKFINKFSSEEIKPFPLTRLMTYKDYLTKYKSRHFKISQFYGDLTPESYQKYCKEMKSLIEKESISNELKENKDIVLEGFESFDLKEDFKGLNKLIITEYSKNSFHGDLNKWLMNSKMNSYECIAYYTARLMYNLNKYGFENNKHCKENKREFYRGVKIPYISLLPYERAKGKIIILSSFTSTTESKILGENFGQRDESKELYETNLKFSVLFIITHLYKNNWISSGISIKDIAKYKDEKEYLFQPYTFYYVRNVEIDIKNYKADIYLETIGKIEILEEKIKYGKEIEYNKQERIVQIKK